MGSVATNLVTMGTGQVLLASVLLGSYTLALGCFVGHRGRLVAITTAVFAAAGFVGLSELWEAGVIVTALVPVGMGLFAGVAWTTWGLTSRTARHGPSSTCPFNR